MNVQSWISVVVVRCWFVRSPFVRSPSVRCLDTVSPIVSFVPDSIYFNPWRRCEPTDDAVVAVVAAAAEEASSYPSFVIRCNASLFVVVVDVVVWIPIHHFLRMRQ
mgnify:CR=1 FL=1